MDFGFTICTSLHISQMGQRDPSVIRSRVLENQMFTLESIGIVTDLDWTDSKTLVTFTLENRRTVNVCWGLVRDTDLYSIQGTLNRNAEIEIIRVGDFEKRGKSIINQGSNLFSKDKSDDGLFVMRTLDITNAEATRGLDVLDISNEMEIVKGVEEASLGTWLTELNSLNGQTLSDQRMGISIDSSYGTILTNFIVRMAALDKGNKRFERNLISPEVLTFDMLLRSNDSLRPQLLGSGSDTRDMGIQNQVTENVNTIEVKLMKLISERLPLILMDSNTITIRMEAIKQNGETRAKYAGGLETLFGYKPNMKLIETDIAEVINEVVPLDCKVSIAIYGMNIAELIIDVGNGPVGLSLNTFTDHLSNTLIGNRAIMEHNVLMYEATTETLPELDDLEESKINSLGEWMGETEDSGWDLNNASFDLNGETQVSDDFEDIII